LEEVQEGVGWGLATEEVAGSGWEAEVAAVALGWVEPAGWGWAEPEGLGWAEAAWAAGWAG
jgi:hypothetical protein